MDHQDFHRMMPRAKVAPPSQPQTIAFAHRGNDWITGSEQCLLDLVAGVDRKRFKPLLICEQPTMARAAAALGATVHQLDPRDDWGVNVPARRREVRREVLGVLKSHNVALVHSNASAIVPILLPAVRRLRVPIVTHIHLPLTDEYRRLNELVHQSSVTVGVADHILQPMRSDGVPAKRMRVILNAVDSTRMQTGDARPLRRELAIPTDAVVVGSIGSLVHRKGHDVTIKAISKARSGGANVHLVVCGSGDEQPRLTSLIDNLGLRHAVHLLGFRSDAGAVLRDAVDLCVSSSREEALPLNVLEAQWLGIPVIVSDIVAHAEALVGENRSHTVPVDDPDALAEALAAFARDPSRARSASNAAREIARERFEMARYVAEFEQLYSELLDRPRHEYGWVAASVLPRAYTDKFGRILSRVLLRRRLAAVSLPPLR